MINSSEATNHGIKADDCRTIIVHGCCGLTISASTVINLLSLMVPWSGNATINRSNHWHRHPGLGLCGCTSLNPSSRPELDWWNDAQGTRHPGARWTHQTPNFCWENLCQFMLSSWTPWFLTATYRGSLPFLPTYSWWYVHMNLQLKLIVIHSWGQDKDISTLVS